MVGRLLKHYGLLEQAPEMMNMAKVRLGFGPLTLEAFHHLHPNFPLWLSAEKIKYVHKTAISDLIRSLLASKIYAAFCDCEISKPKGFSHSGIVFEWLHSPWPMAIMHDLKCPSRKRTLAVQFISNRRLLVVQSFSNFLESLSFTPGSPDSQ